MIVRDLDQAAEVVNDLASEHVQLLLPEPDAFLPKVRNAGAIFLGRWTRGAVRRLRGGIEPRAANRRHRPLLERAARIRLRDGELRGRARRAERGPVRSGTSAIANAEGLVGHAKAMDARASRAEVVEP